MAALMASFFVYCTATLFRYVIAGSAVTTDRLLAAVCVYLLIGLSWAMVYTGIASVDRGTFGWAAAEEADMPIPWPTLLYYSFTTLTTLGYGDITPVSPLARILASLEAVTGVLYVAVLIAGLVGMYSRSMKAGSG
jgi:hypothetical protein